jgi:hypothetical protein
MKVKLSFITIVAIAACSCHEKKTDSTLSLPQVKKENISSSNEVMIPESPYDSMNGDSLIKLVLNNDTNAFKDLNLKLFFQSDNQSRFYYSMLLANRLDYPRAYYEAYASLTLSTPVDQKTWLLTADSRTRNLALYFLSKSAKLGYKHAKGDVALVTELFGRLPEPDELLQFGPDVIRR